MSKKILIVEDSDDARKNMVRLLEERMYNVTPVSNGEDAVSKVQDTAFDLLMLNQFLPSDPGAPTGLEYLGHIKKVRPNIRVILVSGRFWPLLDHRVDAFLPKPFRKEQLIQVVEGIIDIPKWDRYQTDYVERDLYVREQIDTIGEDTLKHILVQLYEDSTQASLWYLSPGFSGSIVLRGQATLPKGSAFFVLKVSKDRDSIENELNAWKIISESGMPKQNAPGLRRNRIASSRGWHAIAYEEIGAGRKRVKNFKEIYRADKGNIGKRLESIFGCLDGFWYTIHEDKPNHLLWQNTYAYDQKTKTRMLSRLDILAPYFRSILKPRTAANYLRMIGKFIEDEEIGSKHIDELAFNTKLCYVHGDLNSRNVLFIDDEPIFIDFATFGTCGHIFTDYAKMEAEVKFVLMDGESCTDIDMRCLPGWVEAEANLLGTQPLNISQTLVSAAVSNTRHVQKAYKLISEAIRDKAQDALPRSHNWEAQYLIALLHHTLKYLIEPDVTDAKRLFVLCSAVMICKKLKTIM